MKLKYCMAGVLLLSLIALAPSASAGWASTVGGSLSTSVNGGTAGHVSAAVYDDSGAGVYDGNIYDLLLTEDLSVTATVGAGQTGSADVSWDTKDAQSYSQVTALAPGNVELGTSLDGVISASATKDSTAGVSTATASMSSVAAYDSTVPNGAIGSAELITGLGLSGIGTAYAEVSDATASYVASYTDASISAVSPDTTVVAGTAAGSIKLTASNEDDSAAPTLGSTVTGAAGIIAESEVVGPQIAAATSTPTTLDSQVSEYLDLYAERSSSVSGKSYVDGSVDGAAYASGVWNYQSAGAATAEYYSTEADGAATIEAESTAINKNDLATSDATVTVHSYYDSVTLGILAESLIDSHAIVNRDHTGTSGLKAEAESYITDATWSADALSTGAGVPALARGESSVSGATGNLKDGQTGFGAGAWIQNVYNANQDAQVTLTQTADSLAVLGTPTDSNYRLALNGVKSTGTLEDAVGAYGAAGAQHLRTDVAAVITTSAPSTTAAIEWLEGTNVNQLPGYYTPLSSTVVTTAGALNRQTTVTYAVAV
jgi:hypothetical protein